MEHELRKWPWELKSEARNRSMLQQRASFKSIALGKRLTSLCMKSQMLQQVVLHTSHWGTGSFSKGAGESSHEFCTDPPRQGEIFDRGGGVFKIGRMASTRFGAF
jgi:hypothetical protein